MPDVSYSLIFQADQRLSGSGSVTAQLCPPSPGVTQLLNFSGNYPASVHSLSGRTLPLHVCHFIFISPSDFKHPGQSWCHSILPVRQGRELLIWLSSKTPASGPAGARPGAAAAPVPGVVLGTLPSQSILLTICFSVSSTILASKLHISWDSIGFSHCSSEDHLCVPSVHRGKWTLLPPTCCRLPTL